MEERTPLTVTALTKYIKYKFDHDVHLKDVLLKGEISNFKRHSRGHFYFTVKDDKAQISAIMFASNASKVPFRPEDGMSIIVTGNISVYEGSGNYQIYVNQMTEEGLGNLYLAYEQLKKKLAEEGLFEEQHKKPIPRFPKTIGVLTSPTGAAVRDIINIVNRRFPLAGIIVYPTLVQGEYAKANIVENIQKANSDKLVDVIILGRGGGSIEDLWPFNEETVAYAIFASTIPIISSVGHETDFTISDYVADLRAPTPSGGAELAVPDRMELLEYITRVTTQNKNQLARLLKNKQDVLQRVRSAVVLQEPLRMLEPKTRRLDHLIDKLELLHPSTKIKQHKLALDNASKLLNRSINQIFYEKYNQFEIRINKLTLLNPLAIMKKGYSITKKESSIVKSIDQINLQDTVEVTLTDGQFQATVTSKKKG